MTSYNINTFRFKVNLDHTLLVPHNIPLPLKMADKKLSFNFKLQKLVDFTNLASLIANLIHFASTNLNKRIENNEELTKVAKFYIDSETGTSYDLQMEFDHKQWVT